MRLDRDKINSDLSMAGSEIQMTGQYLGALMKTEFTCGKGHTWIARASSVRQGNGCPDCSGKKHLTKEQINKDLISSGSDIYLIGEYVNNYTKTEFKCSKGHTWMSLPSNVRAGSTCLICSIDSQKSTRNQINLNLIADGRKIQMTGEYVNANTKTEFTCECGNTWMAKVGNVYNNGTGCPACVSMGFNVKKPAWEYGFIRDGYLKFGISNNLKQRLDRHRYHGEIVLVHVRYRESGQLALDWENGIKRTHGGKFATKEQCPDGWTETLPVNLLEEIKK